MKKKCILIMTIILFGVLKLDIISAENVYREYNIGNIITYNNMEFYVIENSSSTKDYVTTLKVEPLKTEEMSSLIESTEVADFIGSSEEYLTIPYLAKDTCTSAGVSSGNASRCTTDYSLSTVKQIVDVWGKANLLDEDLKEDELGYKVRLLTIDELTNNLGYVREIGASSINYTPTNSPYWVGIGNLNYCTMSSKDDSTSEIWGVNINGIAGTNVYENRAIRPVVNFKKISYINNKKSLTDKVFEIGDIVEYNGTKFYVIKNSNESDETVTLLKAEPLTVDEVNTYGVGYINKYTYDDTKSAKNINNYGGVAYYSSNTCRLDSEDYTYITEGCSVNYDTSDIKKIVDNWANTTFKKAELGLDNLGYSVRLLTIDELKDTFAYVGEGPTATPSSMSYYKATLDTYDWFYNLQNCWTMTGVGDYDYYMYVKNTVGDIEASQVYSNYNTVCPVITLKKQNYNADNNQVVSVPDTFLKQPIIWAMIGIVFVIIGIILGYTITRKKKNTKGK